MSEAIRMDVETIPLWTAMPEAASLVRRISRDGQARPALLIVPGGGYGCVCEATEGTPISDRFEALGFQTFILRYRAAGAGHSFPAPLQDAVRAMRLIRAHAAEWGVDPQSVAACGFSAGAHLAASLGTIVDAVDATAGDAADAFDARPDALVLCYPVISGRGKTADGAPLAHVGSMQNFFGTKIPSEAQCALFSLEEHVTAETPPAFVWATVDDECVSCENALAFSRAMRAAGRPCDLHLFPHGPHGLCLGTGRSDVGSWPEQARAFLRDTVGFSFPGDSEGPTVVLTFDDAVCNHRSFVVPILQQHGFGATFFVTRWGEAWRREHGDTLLTGPDAKALADAGFEIGNHLFSHDMPETMRPEAVLEDADRLDAWLAEAGVRKGVVAAYPGGPHSPKAEAVWRARGYRAARIVEARNWKPARDDPFRIPSYCVTNNGDDVRRFYAVMEASLSGAVGGTPVFVFHGVPELVHPWVDTSPALFERLMAFLHGNRCRVVGLERACREAGLF